MTSVHQSQREDWLEARKSLITASDVASLLCESYSKTEADKAGQRARFIRQKAGLDAPWEGNETTDLASELEVDVIRIARKRFGIDIEPHGWLDVDAVESRMGATSDAMWRHGAMRMPVNVKVTSCSPTDECKPLKSGKPSTAAFANGVPLYYQLQLQCEMAVAGATHGCLLVLHHDQANLRLRMYSVPRHGAVIARIRSEVARAWIEIEELRKIHGTQS